MFALILLVFATPNPVITPGVVRPISQEQVCATKWSRDVRHVTKKMKRTVLSSYGIAYSDRFQYEIDHLIPRELGGSDDIKNLWPQILAEARKVKDPEENRLHHRVCDGTITLALAQEQMRQWGK